MPSSEYAGSCAVLRIGYARLKLLGRTLGLDASVTVYRQEEQMDHLLASGLFDSTTVVRTSAAGLRRSSGSLSSFIAAVTLGPGEDTEDVLTLGAGYTPDGTVWLARVVAVALGAGSLAVAVAARPSDRIRYPLTVTAARAGPLMLDVRP